MRADRVEGVCLCGPEAPAAIRALPPAAVTRLALTVHAKFCHRAHKGAHLPQFRAGPRSGRLFDLDRVDVNSPWPGSVSGAARAADEGERRGQLQRSLPTAQPMHPPLEVM